MFEMIKNFYNLGLYTPEQLDLFVSVGYITKEQKEEIVNPPKVEEPVEPVEEEPAK